MATINSCNSSGTKWKLYSTNHPTIAWRARKYLRNCDQEERKMDKLFMTFLLQDSGGEAKLSTIRLDSRKTTRIYKH
ncbi:CLUMA_CG017054, isoform A [Clunio marinus]|uniref:CLUMA_CG017054, isoform A n=1 Tax=Clunio marinus TaxID=568069 RepID=A0A1J1IUN7_9DIPT|nr:CLUMA_CG017054, isoform A [Clunio marinus]